MIKVLKGMKDRYFEESKKYDFIVQTAEQVFSTYGFEKIITPILEETELFKRSVGDETDVVSKEMYTFIDKGERNVTMRPEGTAGVVRAYLEAGLHKSNPITKWYYYGPMYRYEAPQKGRFREFHQIGVEVFGIRHPQLDAEIITMGFNMIQKCGIENLTVEINTLGNIASRKKYIEVLQQFIEKHFDQLCDNCKKRYKKNPLRVLDCKIESCQTIYKDAPVLYNYLDEESKIYYNSVKEYLDLYHIPYSENPKLVRGLDYYSDTVFEIKSDSLGAQSTVLAGGRYDRLLEILGDVQTPGIGFAAGIERLSLLLDDKKIQSHVPHIYVIYFDETKKYAMNVIQKLRENNISVEFDYQSKSFSNQMKKANKLGIKHVLIVGEDEIKSNQITMKDFVTGEQKLYTIDEIIEKIKK